MRPSLLTPTSFGRLVVALLVSLTLHGCTTQWGSEIQWDSQSQVLISQDSQVRLRSLQSRAFDTTDRTRIMRAAVSTMQDLAFDIDVLDEELGVVSGKKWLNRDSDWAGDPSYFLYETDELLMFNTNYRSRGPFEYRNDLVRMTVTVRPKETTRSLVRASVQYDLRAVEDAEMYDKFFKTLGQSLFLAGAME